MHSTHWLTYALDTHTAAVEERRVLWLLALHKLMCREQQA